MIVMIKSAPDTPEAKRAVTLAGDLGADIVLMQNAVYLAGQDRGPGFHGTVYALDEDLLMRGIAQAKDKGAVERIDYDRLVDLITGMEGVYGAF